MITWMFLQLLPFSFLKMILFHESPLHRHFTDSFTCLWFNNPVMLAAPPFLVHVCAFVTCIVYGALGYSHPVHCVALCWIGGTEIKSGSPPTHICLFFAGFPGSFVREGKGRGKIWLGWDCRMLNQLRLPHVFLSFKIKGTVFKNAHLTSLQALPSPSLLSKSLLKNGAAYASKSHGHPQRTSL